MCENLPVNWAEFVYIYFQRSDASSSRRASGYGLVHSSSQNSPLERRYSSSQLSFDYFEKPAAPPPAAGFFVLAVFLHSAAINSADSMILRISARQEPQLVPAESFAPTASTLEQPCLTAAVIWLTPTEKQEQTMAPGSS